VTEKLNINNTLPILPHPSGTAPFEMAPLALLHDSTHFLPKYELIESELTGSFTKDTDTYEGYNPPDINSLSPILHHLLELPATCTINGNDLITLEYDENEIRTLMTTERNLLFLEMVNKPVLKHDIQSIFFTDGSCKVTVRPGEDPIRLISAAIYQSQNGHNTAYKINADSWTNYGAELIAIWSTVHAARAGDRIMIISDSLSAIQAILYYKYKSIRNQIKKCFAWMIAQICEEILRVQVNNGCVHFFKVKSHVGIIGNMVADALADAAASEHFPMVLTPYEMIDLTASAACLIQIDHHERIHRPIYKTVISNTNSMLAKKALEKARLSDPPKEYTCLQIPIAVDEQGETIQSHTWLSTHLLDRGCYSSRPHFSELLASNRLRVCTRSKMDTPHTECPICHEQCTVHVIYPI